MNKQDAVKVAAGYFKNHTVDSLFITTDEQAFFTKQGAENHAQSLKKEGRDVFEVTREECEGKDDKVAAAKEKKIASLKDKIAEQEEKQKEASDAIAAETDDKKKLKLNNSLTAINKKLEELKADLQSLETE